MADFFKYMEDLSSIRRTSSSIWKAITLEDVFHLRFSELHFDMKLGHSTRCKVQYSKIT